ncbi:MAG: HsmA family protein [Coriobacteriia bacterium]|nr:HsmA family protein [Coriobacteriia bacterium]
MPAELILPTILMTSALAFYSLGVWSERAVRDLRAWHVIAFWLGLTCDGVASWMMGELLARPMEWLSVHGVTGIAAFVLMAAHAAWATRTLLRGTPEARATFHRWSIAVWLIWLVPYFTGMVAGMTRGS